MVAYLALWILVPRAVFLPVLISIIDSALHFAPPETAAVLSIAGIILMAAPTVAFMAVQVAMVYFFSQFKMNWLRCLAVLIASICAVVLLAGLIVKQSGVAAKMGRDLNFREALYVVGVYSSLLRLPLQLAVILAVSSIGYLVSLRVRDRNLILPVVMFAAYIDFWTVTRGPVSTLLKKAPEVAMAVSAPIPAAGTRVFTPQTLVGPGDFLFMALVFAAVHRLGLNGARNYWFVLAGMSIGMLAVSFGLLPYLPALVVLAVSVVAANWRHFKLSRQEAVSTLLVGLVLLASLPLVWSALKPAQSTPKPVPKQHSAPQTR